MDFLDHTLSNTIMFSFSLQVTNAFHLKADCNVLNCRKPIFGSIKDKPKPGKDVIVNFLVVNTTGIKHTHKRFLRQPKQNIISEDVMLRTIRGKVKLATSKTNEFEKKNTNFI